MSKLYYDALYENEQKATAIWIATNNTFKPFLQYLNTAKQEQEKRNVSVGWERVKENHYEIIPSFYKIKVIATANILFDISDWATVYGSTLNTIAPIFNSAYTDQLKVLDIVPMEEKSIVHLDKPPKYEGTYFWGNSQINIEPIRNITSISQRGVQLRFANVQYRNEMVSLTVDNGFDSDVEILINDTIRINKVTLHDTSHPILHVDGKIQEFVKFDGVFYYINKNQGSEKIELFDSAGVGISFRFEAIHIPAFLKSKSFNYEFDSTNNQIYTIANESPEIIESITGFDENGLSYKVSPKEYKDPFSKWIKLIDDDQDEDDFTQSASKIDFFFEDGVQKIESKQPKETFTIIKKNRETQRLLIKYEDKKKPLIYEALPPRLFLPNDIYQLQRQIFAINDLKNTPLQHHESLLALTQKLDVYRWKNFNPAAVNHWYVLTDNLRDGNSTQRSFVQKALATPDFAVLEGPPGSGKTTAILELILQLLSKKKRVLLSASTHVAIDNVLERIMGFDNQIEIYPLRIGDESNVYNDKLKPLVLSNIIEENSRYESVILDAANLVCGTTIGILRHPHLKRTRDEPASCEFDYLIIDESSKTTFQEFLVPAIRASRWILVGDIKQLSPYTDQQHLVANFHNAIDKMGVANLIIAKYLLNRVDYPLCIIVDKTDFKFLCEEINERNKNNVVGSKLFQSNFSLVGPYYSMSIDGKYINISDISQFKSYIRIVGSDVLILSEKAFEACYAFLPQNFHIHSYISQEPEIEQFLHNRREFYFAKNNELYKKYQNAKINYIRSFENTWAKEVVWRMIRNYEARLSQRNANKFQSNIEDLLPVNNGSNIRNQYDMYLGVALPSILESLQNGIHYKFGRESNSVLEKGFPKEAFSNRHEILEYQHRMHPDISRYSRINFYENQALFDSSSVIKERKWNYNRYSSASMWLNTKGKLESKKVNKPEITIMMNELNHFMNWTKKNPQPNGERYSVACLTFYKAQEREIRSKLQELPNCSNLRSSFRLPEYNLDITLHTVDKFQGREADITYISMVQTNKIGFLDSPNRLNVAMTRAKYERVVIGNFDYFSACGVPELVSITKESTKEDK